MGGLREHKQTQTYLNIREGKLCVKQEDGSHKNYHSVEGKITKVIFSEEEYKGQRFEKAKFIIKYKLSEDIWEEFILQMRVDSGYFRGLCNSLRSSDNPRQEVEITPNYTENADGRSKTTCFVSQNKITLKHFFTKENAGELPVLESHTFKGKTVYDNTKQIAYWKNWLIEIFNKETPPNTELNSTTQVMSSEEPSEITAALDDLPF